MIYDQVDAGHHAPPETRPDPIPMHQLVAMLAAEVADMRAEVSRLRAIIGRELNA
jgi:hypothetical protein